MWAAQAVSTRTLLGKSIKFFLAQTYSTAIRPIDIFRTSALEYTVDPEDKTEVGGHKSTSVWHRSHHRVAGMDGLSSHEELQRQPWHASPSPPPLATRRGFMC